MSRYGNKDTTTATSRKQYSSQKLPALDDGNNDDKARLEQDVKKAERALDAATKTAERLEKEADVKAVRRRRRGQEGPGRGQGLAAYNKATTSPRTRTRPPYKRQRAEAKAAREETKASRRKTN